MFDECSKTAAKLQFITQVKGDVTHQKQHIFGKKCPADGFAQKKILGWGHLVDVIHCVHVFLTVRFLSRDHFFVFREPSISRDCMERWTSNFASCLQVYHYLNYKITLGLWVLELFAMYATDGHIHGWTDERTKATVIVPFPAIGGIVNKYCFL